MTDIKSQILAEVEESLGSHAVMVVADAMEKCPTIVAVIANSSVVGNGVSTGFVIRYIDDYFFGDADKEGFKGFK